METKAALAWRISPRSTMAIPTGQASHALLATTESGAAPGITTDENVALIATTRRYPCPGQGKLWAESSKTATRERKEYPELHWPFRENYNDQNDTFLSAAVTRL